MYELYGTEPSFYTRKVAAMLAAQRLPHEWRLKHGRNAAEIEAAAGGYTKFPVLKTPGGDWWCDSTDIGLALDAAHPDRALLPADPALRIVALMLDDWCDEWLVRLAVHWRSSDPETRAWAAKVAALNVFDVRQGGTLPAKLAEKTPGIEAAVAQFFERAGAYHRATADHEDEVIDLMMRGFDLLSAHLTRHPFLLGGRVSLADFALYGMLDGALLWEPKPRIAVTEQWPQIEAFHTRVAAADTSGDWFAIGALPNSLKALLRYAGEDFGGFLRANAAAVAAGNKVAEWDGMAMPARRFTEDCRRRIGDDIHALAPADRAALDAAIGSTGLVDVYTA